MDFEQIQAQDDQMSLMFAKLVSHVQQVTTKEMGGLIWKPERVNMRPKPLPAHPRVDAKGCSAMWFNRIHSVGFRLTWWDKWLGLTEIYAWNHNSTLHVQDVTLTTRTPDWEGCLKILELIRLIPPTE